MLTTLPESRPRPTRRVGSTVASLVLHGALIAAAIALTMTGRADADVAPHAVTSAHGATFIPVTPSSPAVPATGQPRRAEGAVPPSRTEFSILPHDLPPVDVSSYTPPQGDLVAGARPETGNGLEIGPAGPALGSGGTVVGERDVDRPPQVLGTAPQPHYPDALRGAGIAGSVVATFVIDTLGRAEPETIDVSDATRADFGDAVRASLSRYHFLPGEVAGRRVRTRVQMPFAFTLR